MENMPSSGTKKACSPWIWYTFTEKCRRYVFKYLCIINIVHFRYNKLSTLIE
jgi:hypothetical protein